MAYGFCGRVLHVNLDSRRIEVEEPSPAFYRTYMGGRNVALYYLLNLVPRSADPLSADNVLVFATSVVTGAPFPGSGRYTVAAKSPLTGGYGESEAGGFFGPALKFAGFDAVVVTGIASSPAYLLLLDGSAELRDASGLWGKSTPDTEDAIRRELGRSDVRIACIGPAGENLVRFAAVMTDARHANGRTGMGAVMGAKRLKAVVAGGRARPELARPEVVTQKARWFAHNFKSNAVNRGLFDVGTTAGVAANNAIGKLPTRNFREGCFEEAEGISGEQLKQTMFVGQEGCFACPVKCKHVIEVKQGPYPIDRRCGVLEYESVAALGSNCGVGDPLVVAKANELCNRYGLDTISTGVTIAFAMECAERGVPVSWRGEKVTARFGDGKALLSLVTDIALRRGAGDMLAEGTRRVADYLGDAVKAFAMHVKGEEIAMHEPRGKYGVALGYAVAPVGGDHLQAEHDDCLAARNQFLAHMEPLGVREPIDPFDLGGAKVRAFTYLQAIWSFFNVLDLCIFVGPPGRTFSLTDLTEIVGACTGWDTSVWELMKAGERGVTLARCFNLREGIGAAEDRLPNRFHEPLPSGPIAGRSVPEAELRRAIRYYYTLMGWTPDAGIPTRAKLAELDIEWVAAQIDAP